MKRSGLFAVMIFASMLVIAGGNPEHVQLPENYRDTYTHYGTVNRANGKQLAMLYANEQAYQSASKGSHELAEGSKIIMEVYKAKVNDAGEPVIAADGLIEKGKFAAIAIMEKRAEWSEQLLDEHKAGDWAFAIYQTNGEPKANDLDCAGCHQPLEAQDYRFTHSILSEFFSNIQ